MLFVFLRSNQFSCSIQLEEQVEGGSGGQPHMVNADRLDIGQVRGLSMYFFMCSSLGASHNLVPLSCSTIVTSKQVGQQQGKYNSVSSAGWCRVSFLRIAFLFLLRWHSLNLSLLLPSFSMVHGGQGYRRR